TINGIAFRLTDTAGIRQASDIIEKQGVERTMQKIGQASIVLYLFDAETMTTAEVQEDIKALKKENETPILPVANKVDTGENLSHKFAGISRLISISAKNGKGIGGLKNLLYETALQGRHIQEGV